MLFDNVPSFDHLAKKKHAEALAQHRAWEDLLARQPEGLLHNAVSPPHACGLPRQTLAFLIAKYCTRSGTEFDDLMRIIKWLSFDRTCLSLPARLVQPATSSKATVVNLLALDDETLWRLYVDIPEQCRPKEKPKVHRPLVGAALKTKKRRIRFDGTIIMPKRPKPEAPPVVPVEQPPVFSEVCWVCCDLCSKWRRIPGKEDDLPERWACIDHPLGNVTCETPEEQMDADEMWDGATHGRDDAQAAEDDYDSATESAIASTDQCQDDAVEESDLFGDGDSDQEADGTDQL